MKRISVEVQAMQGIAKFVKPWLSFLLGMMLILGVTGCGIVNIKSNEPLPAVAPLPLPELPDWIEQISPTGEAKPLAQIRVIFKEPLIPVERIDTPQQKDILNKFAVLPPLPGQFRFLTPRMVGFQGDKAIPKATRVQVTLKAGLADLKGNKLEADLPWTFNTETIQLTNLPQDTEPIELKPSLTVTSNLELELGSVRNQVSLIPEGKENKIALQVELKPEDSDSEEQLPEEKFDPSQQEWNYILTPKQTLEKATRYRLEFAAGMVPANGNLASETKFYSNVKTYSPLALEEIEAYGKPDAAGTYGRFAQGSPQLRFNNGLMAESVEKNITLKPAPKQDVKLLQFYDGDRYVGLNPWALEPNRNYTISLGKNLQDQFGQTLDKNVTLSYKTGDIAPDIWAPTGLNIFPSGTDLQLHISTVNLPEREYQAAYRVVEPTDLVYTDTAYPQGEGKDLLPDSSKWTSFRAGGKRNQVFDHKILLGEELQSATGMLAYGVKGKTNSYQQDGQKLWREPKFYGLIQLTNLGVFSQWFPDSGLIRVNHLGDGSAVKNATIEVYQSQLEGGKTPPKKCAIATTDETGTAVLSGEVWKQCLKHKSAPELLVIAREGEDWAFVRTDDSSGAYSYGIYAGWDEGKPISRGTIFSDRQLYQPGEKAWFTVVAYYLQAGELKQDKNKSYQVTLKSPDGKETDLGKQTTNEFGTFSLELPLDKNQPLGFYSLQGKGESGAEIYGEFRVAEFKPPNFKVELNLDREFAFVDQKVQATATSNYLFGSPVQAAKVNYFVTRRRTYFTPKGWNNFSFGRQWFWPEEEPAVTSDVLQGSQILDATGKDSQQVAVAQDLPYPMTYSVEAQVTDVSNLSVSNTQTFTALPSNRLIGLHSDFVAEAGKSVPVEIVVADVTGKAISGEQIRVELQQMKYSQVTQLQEGSRTSRNQVEYKTITQQLIRSADEPQTVSFTPPESGSYRIRANFANSKDEVTATDTQIWVTGEGEVSWGNRYDNDRLEIKLDKESYKPGETATALIQSPYPEGELYFAVVRHDTIYKTIEKVKGGAPEIQFTVTPDMVPNAAVEAVLVRQGQPISQTEPGSLDNLVRIGFAPFNTNLEDKYLQVEVQPQQEKSEPGNQETIVLKLENKQGNPIAGQFTVMVVNEAILQLTGYRPPDLVKTVYAEQEITTRLADNRPEVVLTSPASPLDKGWGYGGGESVGAANTRIREDFRPLAYYNGSVLTDAEGKASITFTLPDDLTTWRVMAVGTDGDFHFGTGEATFVTTKPLVTNPVLPQFVRLGDRFLAGLSVTNTAEKKGKLLINGSLGNNLKFEDQTSLRTDAESGTRAYRFPMLGAKVGEGKVQFSTQLNGERDGFAVPLEVKDLPVTEQVVESGVTSSGATIPLEVDNQVVPDAGGLEVFLASTLIPQLTLPAQEVLQENQLPFLEPSASQLAIAANLEILTQQYQQAFPDFNLTQAAAEAVANLAKLQRDDGGFAAWTGQERSDPFVSPYAATSLAQAQDAGLTVDGGMISRLQTYLEGILANPGQYEFCRTASCKNQVRLEALIALAELGNKRTDYLGSIYEQKDTLDPFSQIQLARYLSQFPDWQTEAQNLFNQLQETVSQRGRFANVNLPQSWRWFHSPTAAQAEMLRLSIAQKANPEVLDRLLQGLLGMRRELTWGNSFDNAQALSAVVTYSQLQPTPPNYSAIVKLGRRQLGKARFQGYRNSSLEVKVPMSELPRGPQDLILEKSGSGNLHYLTAYRYRLQGNQPGRLQGLRVLRYIRPANQEQVLGKMNLYAAEEPLTIPAGQVFDIGLEIITDHRVDHLVINDPLTAGLEAVDTSFQTASSYYQAQGDSWEISYQKIYKDKVVAYGDSLAAGVYSLHYLVRSVTPGTFEWPGAEVYLQYAPEEFGRCASSMLEVKE